MGNVVGYTLYRHTYTQYVSMYVRIYHLTSVDQSTQSLQFLSRSSPTGTQVHSGVSHDMSHDRQQDWAHRLQLKLNSNNDTNEDVISFIEVRMFMFWNITRVYAKY